MVRSVLIVGAGHAGTNAARTLREQGWGGEVEILTEEQSLPYDRPPLSKSILTREKSLGDIETLAPGWFEKHAVRFRAGTKVERINRQAATVSLADGEERRYDFLLLATGSRARLLEVPGFGLEGVFTLRSKDQSSALRERLSHGKRLIVIGGGLIGLEVAASARARGVEVTVVEKSSTLLSRVMPAAIGDKILQLHRDHGANIILGADVEAITGNHGAEGVLLKSGQQFDADTVLISVGAIPDVDLARSAGLATDGGIAVNQYLQTSDPRIFAAGDVARYPSRTGETTVRSESWKNALDQGATAALNIMGRNEPYAPVPWMWSDQFEHVVQVAGLPNVSQTGVNRKLKNGGLATFLLGAGGELEATAAFGELSQVARVIRSATTIIERGLRPSQSSLTNPDYDLRTFLRSAASGEGRHDSRLLADIQ